MRRLASDESGFTLVELIMATVITVIVMAGLADVFVSGMRGTSNASARLSSQVNVRLSLDRLDFEARCASTAALVSSGAGVTLTLPSQCPHASGSITWCVANGTLTRYVGTSCTGTTYQRFVGNVTSAHPFSCVSTVGDYPLLQVVLSVNTISGTSTSYSSTDDVAMRNAALTTSTTSSCS